MMRISLATLALVFGTVAQAQDYEYAAQAFYRMQFGGPQAGLTQSLGYVAGPGSLEQRAPSLEYRWSPKATELRLAGVPVAVNGQVLGAEGKILGMRPEVFWGTVVVLGAGTAVVVASNAGDDKPSGSGSGSGGN